MSVVAFSRGRSVSTPLEKPQREYYSCGVESFDALCEGVPKGAISEIYGNKSSGKAALAMRVLAVATKNAGEVCAYVDLNNALDPISAAKANVNLPSLLWVRCNSDLLHAFIATGLLIEAGGFGLVVFDMTGASQKQINAINLSYWFRFQRVIEKTRSSLLVLSDSRVTNSCSSLVVETQRTKIFSPRTFSSQIFAEARLVRPLLNRSARISVVAPEVLRCMP